jgi:hypothetical protein
MMAWRFFIPNIGWVLGATIILSAWSFWSYRIARDGRTGGLRRNWACSGFRRALFLGALLISLSQVLISQALWRQLVWIFFCVVCVYRLCRND